MISLNTQDPIKDISDTDLCKEIQIHAKNLWNAWVFDSHQVQMILDNFTVDSQPDLYIAETIHNVIQDLSQQSSEVLDLSKLTQKFIDWKNIKPDVYMFSQLS